MNGGRVGFASKSLTRVLRLEGTGVGLSEVSSTVVLGVGGPRASSKLGEHPTTQHPQTLKFLLLIEKIVEDANCIFLYFFFLVERVTVRNRLGSELEGPLCPWWLLWC